MLLIICLINLALIFIISFMLINPKICFACNSVFVKYKLFFGILIGIIISSIVVFYIHYNNISTFNLLTTLNCQKHNGEQDQVQKIPKIIHRTWKDNNLNKDYQDAWDYTAKKNPEYKQILYTDQDILNFLSSFSLPGIDSKTMVETFNSLVYGAAKADFFRYCVLYHYGGVYLDIKSAANELKQLIKPHDKLIISTWSDYNVARDMRALGFHNFGEIEQWWLASAPRSPIYEKLVSEIVMDVKNKKNKNDVYNQPYFFNLGHQMSVLKLTGPLKYTKVILDYVKKYGSNDVTITCPNGNNTFIYDFSGNHQGSASYQKPGKIIK